MKKFFFFAMIVAAAMLSSCGTVPEPGQISCKPNPLTVVGGKVNAEITGTFPAKKFAKKGVLVVTPVLKYNGKELLGTPVTYVGENVKENGKIVNYKAGGTYSQSVSFDYVPEMVKSELYLRFEARKGKKVIEIPEVKVADGVNTTSLLINPKEARTQITPDRFQRIIQETQEADILFLIQQAELRNSQLTSQEMKDLKAAIKEADKADNKSIHSLEVKGYASPDGAVDLNTRLATNRQSNSRRYLQSVLRQSRVKASIDDTEITAEDWEGFKKAVAASNLPDKDVVLRVLNMYSDPEQREAEIKKLSSVYSTLAVEILPALRRSRLILTTDIIGKSDEEIATLAKNNPAALNVDELLYSATLTNNDAEKMAIYEKVTNIYKEDHRGWNNLGMCYFEKNNVAEARRCYAKALAIAPNDADVNYNAGIAAMVDGDLQKAESCLGKAAGTKGDLETALGTLYTMKGDYKKAKGSYGASHNNNTAVQQILNEDYAGARKTLDAVENPNATTAYLSAIVGARTNNREAVYTNMRKAVGMDASMKARAMRDIEFAKYMEDSQFLEIVK